MDKDCEQMLRGMAASLDCDFRAKSPYQMGDLRIEKVGRREIPVVFVLIACQPKALKAIERVVRQFIYRELAAAGSRMTSWNSPLRFKLGGKSDSWIVTATAGPRAGKRSDAYRFAFRIKPPFMGFFFWGGFLIGLEYPRTLVPVVLIGAGSFQFMVR